jgi:phosphatidylinositol alpha-1,6-mannosyltransferase
LNILLTASTYPPVPGGVETYAFEMARGLDRLGERVTVLARSRARHWAGDAEIRSGPVRRAYAKPLLRARFWSFVRKRPDVLFLTHRADFLTWALAAKRARGIPVALTLHGTELYGRRDLARIIAPVNAPDTVPAALAGDQSGAGRPAGSVILSAGRFRAVKGFDRMIRALPAVLSKAPDAGYVLVGEGPEEGKWKALSRDLGVADHVLWIPPVPFDRWGRPPHAYYNACDVFVGPSVSDPATGDVEAFGIAFLEAAACGKPVVVGRSGGAPETVEDGVTGIVVDAESPDDLAGAVLRLLADPDLRKKMGEAGRRRVENEYNWTVSVRKVREVLKRIAGRPD